MDILIAVVFGLMFGSFLNVCIHRLPHEQSIVRPRSRCPHCGHVLSPAELVPVVSWIIQLGRCRSCKQNITPRYAAVELITAGIFVFCLLHFWRAGRQMDAVVWAVYLMSFVVITCTDLEHFLILNVVTYPGMAFAALMALPGHFPLAGATVSARLIEAALGAAVAGGLLWLVSFLGALYYRSEGREAMGLGDVKLGLYFGAFLGGPRPAFYALVIAVFSAALISGLLLATGMRSRKDYVPFGPALVFGAILAPFHGARFVDFMLHWPTHLARLIQ